MGLVMHVINHTAQCRSILLSNPDREDLAAEVMLTLLQDDFAVLRRFQGKSSLATYLAVIARRVVVRQLLQNRTTTSLGEVAESALASESEVERRLTNREEVEQLLHRLDDSEARVMRLFHLKSAEPPACRPTALVQCSAVSGRDSGFRRARDFRLAAVGKKSMRPAELYIPSLVSSRPALKGQ